ncbi:hypothetical protein ASE75_12520 [Sphingomonas sp. Leaf17]|uniref:hypothetical protein n=1 Tax=Sphingomonas sp. Leaf17 TaxID=1735683 RepID=UPI0006FE4E62|nr:hypothetical protein [Sphingomonas sp. Leaf17]KQM63290.1 hypothetical protein ASE75_12520 [Sphingomonas sp. Leaf17]
MTREPEGRRFGHWARDLKVTLWTLIVPPTIWAAHFLFCYLWVAVTCAKRPATALNGFPLATLIATIVALLGIAAAGYVARVQSQTPGDPPPHEQGTAIDRLRFLALSTRLLAGLSFVAVLFTALPVIVFGDCR